MYVIIMDTYPDFKRIIYDAKALKNDIVGLWLNKYMRRYDELVNLQLKCHGDMDTLVNMASKLIKPLFNNLWKLDYAWRNIYKAIPIVLERLVKLQKDFPDVNIVIYVGSGCGAGWATMYNGKYSVLLGLEMIIYHNWTNITDLSGLLAHELCHILHMYLRGLEVREFEKLEDEPWFLLYSEGFAMKCEHIITNRMWRIADKDDWIDYCEKNKNRLAREYLETIEKGYPTLKFYSSWHDINGYTQTGYYLGQELIEYLMKEHGLSLEKIARMNLDNILRNVIEFLRKLSYSM